MFGCTKPLKFHSWGAWKAIDQGSVLSTGSVLAPEAPYVSGKFVLMQRVCKDCEFIQLKTSKS